MGAAVFEVGLFKPDDQRKDNEPAMIPRVWEAETLMRSVPWMKFHNLQGRNIYVRPKGEHDLSLVDDLNAEAVERMNTSGFKPAVLVETSAGNFQAWLKHSRVLSKEVSTAAARALAEQFGGDKGAADWRHFGRLARFTNRKLKYQSPEGLFPFVRLVAAPVARIRRRANFWMKSSRTCKWRHSAGRASQWPAVGRRDRNRLRPSNISERIQLTAAMERGPIWLLRFMRCRMGWRRTKWILHCEAVISAIRGIKTANRNMSIARSRKLWP